MQLTSGGRAAFGFGLASCFEARVHNGRAPSAFQRADYRFARQVQGWVAVKVPPPLHPPPDRVQLPEMVLPITFPLKLRTLLVVPVMVSPNEPCTLPLKLPLRVNEPISVVVSEAKQGAVDVKVKVVTLSPLPLPWVKVVEKL